MRSLILSLALYTVCSFIVLNLEFAAKVRHDINRVLALYGYKIVDFNENSDEVSNRHYDIEIIDNDEDGNVSGEIVSIIYKGDHYQVIIRTDEDEDFVVDTEYTWNEFDKVSIKIPKECIKMTLKREAKEYVKD